PSPAEIESSCLLHGGHHNAVVSCPRVSIRAATAFIAGLTVHTKHIHVYHSARCRSHRPSGESGTYIAAIGKHSIRLLGHSGPDPAAAVCRHARCRAHGPPPLRSARRGTAPAR